MTSIVINSQESLQRACGDLRELWNKHKFLRLDIKKGTGRSLPQNAITHAWYGQLALELQDTDELGWKCYCKLHYGVPILRAEDEEFREVYDSAVKPMSYENKLVVMRHWPVSSIMTKEQLSKYAEMMQTEFAKHGVMLEFPINAKS